MAKIRVSSVMPASVERVWEYIRDFNGLPKWFPGVTDSHIEAGPPVNQAGCVRNLGLENGARLREELIELSDQEHRCDYKMIEVPLPIKNYVATVQLSPVAGNRAHIEISLEFETPPAQEKEMVGMLKDTYEGACELLKKHFGKAKKLSP